MYCILYFTVIAGLLRGVDPGRRVFYLSTPEGGERLNQVNVLVAGNTDHPDFMMAPTQVLWHCTSDSRFQFRFSFSSTLG